jgi:hypothetical protein
MFLDDSSKLKEEASEEVLVDAIKDDVIEKKREQGQEPEPEQEQEQEQEQGSFN